MISVNPITESRIKKDILRNLIKLGTSSFYLLYLFLCVYAFVLCKPESKDISNGGWKMYSNYTFILIIVLKVLISIFDITFSTCNYFTFFSKLYELDPLSFYPSIFNGFIIKILSCLQICIYCIPALLRLLDIKQLCWRQINYILINFIYFLLNLCIQLFCCVVCIVNLISFINKVNEYPECINSLYVQIATFVLALIILAVVIFNYMYFELFTPKGLEQAQKEIEQDLCKDFTLEVEETTKTNEFSKASKLRKYVIISRSAFKFMPEFARFLRITQIGTRRCASGSLCSSVDLEHIFYCHNTLNIPNENLRCCYVCSGRKGYMVGFHQTKYEFALKIALSPMRPTKEGMFGDGIYFARYFAWYNQF